MKLFGNTIEPCCIYCEYARNTVDKLMLLCPHKGIVASHYSCKKYKYAPLKRVPKKLLVLPKYNDEDFKL